MDAHHIGTRHPAHNLSTRRGAAVVTHDADLGLPVRDRTRCVVSSQSVSPCAAL
jgi:hypothetical protein